MPAAAAEEDEEEAEEASSDEDSIPEQPEFEMTVPWFRRVAGFEGRRPYLKTTCVVTVRLTDTLETFRRKVREQTELSHFKLVVAGSGQELIEGGGGSDGDEEGGGVGEGDGGENGGGSTSGGGSQAEEGGDEAADMAILLAVRLEEEQE